MSPVEESGTQVEIRPGDLSISDALARGLREWAEEYDATFDQAFGSSGFGSEAHAVTFVEKGRDLVARLQAELGESWHVEYMPEPIRPPGVRLRINGN
jgi:hypothetical protein